MCVLRDTYLVDDPAYREDYEEETRMQSQGYPKVQLQDESQARVDCYPKPDKPQLHLVTETVEETTVITETSVEHAEKRSRFQWHGPVTAYYWCRICKKKTPATMARSCDCGVTMCNSCWQEWDLTCPICESDMS